MLASLRVKQFEVCAPDVMQLEVHNNSCKILSIFFFNLNTIASKFNNQFTGRMWDKGTNQMMPWRWNQPNPEWHSSVPATSFLQNIHGIRKKEREEETPVTDWRKFKRHQLNMNLDFISVLLPTSQPENWEILNGLGF